MKEENNPLLEPIHGISLYDYSAINAKIVSGMTEEEVCKIFQIEPAVWQEASALWIARMQQDTDFVIAGLMGKYFADADNHPKFKNQKTSERKSNPANLDRLKTERYYFEELNGAREAAYDYGFDGAQWIEDNFGITLSDFQGVAMQWSAPNNQEFSPEAIQKVQEYFNYREEKKKEYAEKFAAEQGGNIADDIEF